MNLFVLIFIKVPGLSPALSAARPFPSGAHPQQPHSAHRGWGAEAQPGGAPLWPALLEVGTGQAKSQPVLLLEALGAAREAAPNRQI